MLISIIIPAYNMENYLNRTLNSIYCQKSDDIEVVVVNDGSTDNTLSVLEEYRQKHEDFNLKIINKQNGGLADARNVGLKNAVGKYFINLDADDYLIDGIISKLKKKISACEFDVCFYGFNDVYEFPNKIKSYDSTFKYISQPSTGLEVAVKKLSREIWICQGSACYKKAIVEQRQIYNIPGLNQGEDFHFIMKFLLCSKSVVCIDSCGVNIECRADSMMHSSFNPTFLQIFSAFDLLFDFIKRSELSDEHLISLLENEFEITRLSLAKKMSRAYPFYSIRKCIKKYKSLPPKRTVHKDKMNKIKKIESFLFNHCVIMYFYSVKFWDWLLKLSIPYKSKKM